MAAVPHLLVVTLQALVWAGVTVWLFRQRTRLGLGFFAAAIVMMGQSENYSRGLVPADVAPIIENFGGSLLFSCKLLAVLLLYVREDAAQARNFLYGCVVGALGSLLIAATSLLHGMPAGLTWASARDVLFNPGIHAFGMTILIVDAIVLILAYEWLAQRAKSLWLSAFGALALALSVDNIIFYMIFAQQQGFGELLLQSFLGKWYAALVYSLIFVAAVRWHQLGRTEKHARRLTDMFDALTFRQRFEALQRRAAFDGLTGLKSRASFDDEAAALLQPGSTIAVIDIDHFKRINDAQGHLAGDAVLQSVAARLRNALPKGVEIFRFGGEEFVAIGTMSQLDLDAAREAVASTPHHNTSATISIGAHRVAAGSALNDAFEQADKLLYAAKAAGRNRVKYAD